MATDGDERFRPPPVEQPVLELEVRARPAAPARTTALPAPGEPDGPVVYRVVTDAGRCRRHPGQVAGWWCEQCDAALCPACTKTQQLSLSKTVPTCASCGRAPRAITVPRSRVTPMSALVRRALGWPLRPAGLTFIVLLSLLGAVPIMGWVGYAVAWAYLFALVKSTGRGGARLLPADTLSEGPEDLFKPAFRGVAAAGWLWIPTALYLERRYELSSGGASILEVAGDPVLWLLPVLGLPSLPIAAMAAATDVALIDLFNPVFLGKAVVRIGRDYWQGVAVVGALCLFGAVAQVVIAGLTGEGWASAVARALVLNYVSLASARVVGGILYLHGHTIGWGDESDYRIPVLDRSSS